MHEQNQKTEKNDQLLTEGIFVMDIPEDFAAIEKSKWPKEVPPLDSAWAYVIESRVKRLLAVQAKQIRMEERDRAVEIINTESLSFSCGDECIYLLADQAQLKILNQ